MSVATPTLVESGKSSDEHKGILEMMKARRAAMTPEQRAAQDAKNALKLEPRNLVPTWVSLEGKTVVITGANQGVGFHTARKLSLLGKPRVVLACRSKEKGDKAAAEIASETKNENVEAMVLDLGSLDSVRAFAKAFRAKGYPIDALVLNAGIMATPYQKSKDGHEMQFQVNHLSQFLLFNLLSDLIPAKGRVTVLSSGANYMCQGFDWAKIEKLEEKDYERWSWYCVTKALNVLFVLGIQKRFAAKGIVVSAVHPGFVKTSLQGSIGLSWKDYQDASGTPAVEPHRGADCSVYTVAVPGIPSGKYWDNTEPVPPNKLITEEAADKLWALSEKMIGK